MQGLRSISETTQANIIKQVKDLSPESMKSLLTRLEDYIREDLDILIAINIFRDNNQLLKNVLDGKKL